jgi:hypothetical protein
MRYPDLTGNRTFSLSYDPKGTDHIFTLGEIDPRYKADGANTSWA